MRRLAVAFIVAGVLTPTAQAQPELRVKLCGASGCEILDPGPISRRLAPWNQPTQSPRVEIPPIGPYYELELEIPEGTPGTGWFVPSHDVLRTDFFSGRLSWIAVPEGTGAALQATTSVEPWPAPKLTRVLVGDGEAARPAIYADLYDDVPEASFTGRAKRTISIFLNSARPSPWTDGYVHAEYLPERNILLHDGRWFRLPKRLAVEIERDADLHAEAEAPSAWPGYFTTAAFAFLIAAILWLNRRGRQQSQVRVK